MYYHKTWKLHIWKPGFIDLQKNHFPTLPLQSYKSFSCAESHLYPFIQYWFFYSLPDNLYCTILKLHTLCSKLIELMYLMAGFTLSPVRPFTIGGLSSSSSSSGAALSFLSILLTDVVRLRWTSVSNSSSNRTWSTRSGCTGLGSAGGFGVP